MTLAFDSLQRKTIQEVLEWYNYQAEILGREKTRVLAELRSGVIPSDSRFFTMNRDDIEDFFNLHRNELDFLAMLDLMSAAEASLRLDYLSRVGKRLKDPVSRCFRAINKKLSQSMGPGAIRLEDDILDTWASQEPGTRSWVSDFKAALKLRHWLAHGRYWNPKLGRQQYSPGDVFDISDNLLRAVDACKS